MKDQCDTVRDLQRNNDRIKNIKDDLVFMANNMMDTSKQMVELADKIEGKRDDGKS